MVAIFLGIYWLDLSITHGYRHDVGLQIVGQPARDLGRHFVQR
jgi:phosphatidylserine/phosphatidylglycerophosphate/cardiolipin synthase-like enzyme